VASIDFERQVLEEAATSPVAAVMRLSMEIDRELRKLLAVIGVLNRYPSELLPDLPEAIELLNAYQKDLPRELKEVVSQFWSLRNFVVHNQVGGEQLPLRVLDYGFRILKLLTSIPRHSYIVYKANISLFKDNDCHFPRNDVRGVILETLSPEGKSLGKHIYPTTRVYKEGMSVSWEWNMHNRKGWDETWYKDPDAGETKMAWSGSLEFTGRDMNQF